MRTRALGPEVQKAEHKADGRSSPRSTNQPPAILLILNAYVRQRASRECESKNHCHLPEVQGHWPETNGYREYWVELAGDKCSNSEHQQPRHQNYPKPIPDLGGVSTDYRHDEPFPVTKVRYPCRGRATAPEARVKSGVDSCTPS